MKKNHRQYDNEYPSVTQVLDVLRKIGLEMWFKLNTIEFINAESEKGKLIGTQIHEAIQQHIDKEEVKVETQYAEEVSNALNAFMQFKKDHPEMRLKKAEMQLTSQKYQYNGTLDCIGMQDKKLILLDWKTGKCKKDKDEPEIYPEYRYQVAAYVLAHNEIQEKPVERAYILVLAKDKIAYKLEELDMKGLQESFEEVFLPALRIYKYQHKK